MTWIETIRIILGRGNRGVEHLEVLKSLESELASARSLQWEIYRNMSAPEDILIVLRWERGPPTHLESDIALTLAREGASVVGNLGEMLDGFELALVLGQRHVEAGREPLAGGRGG